MKVLKKGTWWLRLRLAYSKATQRPVLLLPQIKRIQDRADAAAAAALLLRLLPYLLVLPEKDDGLGCDVVCRSVAAASSAGPSPVVVATAREGWAVHASCCSVKTPGSAGLHGDPLNNAFRSHRRE